MYLPEMIFPNETAANLLFLLIFSLWLSGTLRQNRYSLRFCGIWLLPQSNQRSHFQDVRQTICRWPFPPMLIVLLSAWLPLPVILIHLVSGWIVENIFLQYHHYSSGLKSISSSSGETAYAPIPYIQKPSGIIRNINHSLQSSAFPVASLALLWHIVPADHTWLQLFFRSGYDLNASHVTAWAYIGWILGSGSIHLWLWYFAQSVRSATTRHLPLWLTARVIHGTVNAALIKWLLIHPSLAEPWF